MPYMLISKGLPLGKTYPQRRFGSHKDRRYTSGGYVL